MDNERARAKMRHAGMTDAQIDRCTAHYERVRASLKPFPWAEWPEDRLIVTVEITDNEARDTSMFRRRRSAAILSFAANHRR